MSTNSKYPWDKWIKPNAKSRRLLKGRHYNCETNSMSLLIRQRCTNYNQNVNRKDHIRAQIHVLEIGGLEFKIVYKNPELRRKRRKKRPLRSNR